MKPRPFVLLDRDGTLIVERHYLADPAQIELIPGAAHGLRALAAAGIGTALVTNQSGVGRGYFTESTLAQIHARLMSLLFDEGVELQGLYYCPHIPDDDCACRKPRTELAERAARDHGLDLRHCFVVGDNTGDIELGHRIGATTVLVRTGHGHKVPQATVDLANYVVPDLAAACEQILRCIEARDPS